MGWGRWVRWSRKTSLEVESPLFDMLFHLFSIILHTFDNLLPFWDMLLD